MKSKQTSYHKSNHIVYKCTYHIIFCPKYRRKIFETLYSTYDEHKNTYANIYSATLNMENAERKSSFKSICE